MPSIHQLGTAPAQFQLRTGNINGNLELKCTNFSNSAEELEQWIALQSEDSINDNMEDDRMTLHSRNDLKVTFKIFMTKWEVESIEKAIEALKEKLKIKDIEIDRAAEKSQTTLLGRYTVFIRARAVMISKGYIAQLEETN
ncbi:hypothetical protein L3Y34_013776 [Caenorhabditis briggsae]|uniref:Uncharacterized protein n=1 Tax=Caenorhabditis briggsae TaxID=6238 RepID=A0AAE8ZXQ7_CAEBR|nr:hypothetical protein L3Y34_013772 [Caenorhabditis briggsae]ULT85233.1 hypothetical protein L3Y34_013776 [Caenorhabditis briggsae]